MCKRGRTNLDAEDAPDRGGRGLFGLFENGPCVVQITFDEGDVGRFGGQSPRGRGRGIAREGEHLKACLLREQRGDDGAALLASGAGDENSARHNVQRLGKSKKKKKNE